MICPTLTLCGVSIFLGAVQFAGSHSCSPQWGSHCVRAGEAPGLQFLPRGEPWMEAAHPAHSGSCRSSSGIGMGIPTGAGQGTACARMNCVPSAKRLFHVLSLSFSPSPSACCRTNPALILPSLPQQQPSSHRGAALPTLPCFPWIIFHEGATHNLSTDLSSTLPVEVTL